MTPIEKHAQWERRLSIHRASGECKEQHISGLCPVALLRDIAYREYTKQRHVSDPLRGVEL